MCSLPKKLWNSTRTPQNRAEQFPNDFCVRRPVVLQILSTLHRLETLKLIVSRASTNTKLTDKRERHSLFLPLGSDPLKHSFLVPCYICPPILIKLWRQDFLSLLMEILSCPGHCISIHWRKVTGLAWVSWRHFVFHLKGSSIFKERQQVSSFITLRFFL